MNAFYTFIYSALDAILSVLLLKSDERLGALMVYEALRLFGDAAEADPQYRVDWAACLFRT